MGEFNPTGNFQPPASGVTDDANLTPTALRVDPTTKRLKVDASISSYTGVTDGEAVDGDDTGTLILGTDGTNYQVAKVDSDGNLQVDVLSGGGGTEYSDGDANADPTGAVAMGTDGTNVFALHTDTAGDLQIDVLTMPTTTVTATDLDIRDLTATDVVTANLSATDNAVLDDIAADTESIKTAVEIIDNAVATEGSALGSGILLQGDDGTDRTNVLVNTAGHLQIDVLTAPSI